MKFNQLFNEMYDKNKGREMDYMSDVEEENKALAAKIEVLTNAANVAVTVIDEILEAMEYGELPEYRQEALRNAHEMLTKSLAQ